MPRVGTGLAIYGCRNGHLLCQGCVDKIQECPICRYVNNFIQPFVLPILLVFSPCLLYHYSRFGDFLFKNHMPVKTVQTGCFTIKSIIIVHISSLKRVLKKCENLQKISLILFNESQFFWTFFDLYPPCP